MTQSLEHGYPDWGRYTAKQTQVLLDETPSIGTGGQNLFLARAFVGAIPYVGVIFRTVQNDNISVTIGYHSALTGGVLLGRHSFVVLQGDVFAHALPVRGPFLQIIASSNAVTATSHVSIYEASSGGPVDFAGVTMGEILTTTGTFGVGAGGSVTRVPDVTWPGKAVWSINADQEGFPWRATLNRRNVANSDAPLYWLTDPCERSHVIPVNLPLAPVTVTIHNDDSVLHSFSTSVIGEMAWF